MATTNSTPGGRTITNWHDVLGNRPRRLIIHCLTEMGRPVTLTELSRYVETLDGDRTSDASSVPASKETDVERCRRVVIELADFGVVEYDPERDVVRLGDGVSVTVPPPSSKTPGRS